MAKTLRVGLIGYEHTFIHTVADFVNACVEGKPVSPTF